MSIKDLLATLQQQVTAAQTKASPLQQAAQQKISVGQGVANNPLSSFLNAISTQESGGNYQAVGVPTRSGRAYGKYQILDANFVNPGGWDKEALGRDITLAEYLNTPDIQEQIARSKLTQYFEKYGAEGAAKAWYAGEGNANTSSNSPQYGGPSINNYAASVLQHMQR